MATAIASKPILSTCFSNKSIILSLHRLHHSQTHKLATAPKDELQEIFLYFDADGNGKISGPELRSYLASIGEFLSPEDAQAVINDLDAAGGDNLMLEFDDFVKLMEREGGDDDLKRAFEMFAGEKGGSGCITPERLQKIFGRLGHEVSIEECKGIVQVFDRDGDGVLGFPEFQQLMA
ncbi:hypothetical protein NE237_018704 [Protea cynaroides]|uniref:EF-hand domain-containing protein n=1 Tax=Protea cynaroides TaxID=273540 RepID=A0A9Q0QP93_9MAGN|nr:hypothetical protein NE237_018704 [Protea cynaroides]